MNSPQQRVAFSGSASEGSVSTASSTIEIDIDSSTLCSILTYPHISIEEYAARMDELKSLGITSFMLGGRTRIGRLEIAGKGCVGLVLRTKVGKKVFALKVRRTDADRKTMYNEAERLKIANSVGVGPQLDQFSKNFIIMEFIEGPSILNWATKKIDDINVDNSICDGQARGVAHSILEQTYNLDRALLDHGELSRLDHHVIVTSDRIASIIDFESASTSRAMCNVTASAQSMLLSGALSSKMKRMLEIGSMATPGDKGQIKRSRIIKILQVYKREQNRQNFEKIMDLF